MVLNWLTEHDTVQLAFVVCSLFSITVMSVARKMARASERNDRHRHEMERAKVMLIDGRKSGNG